MVSPDEIQKIILQAQKEYLEALPKTILLIRNLVQKGDLAQYREEFHKLKGTGKTYHLDEISTLSELIESLCLNSPESISSKLNFGIDLLEQIYLERKNNNIFNLELSSDYQVLKRLQD